MLPDAQVQALLQFATLQGMILAYASTMLLFSVLSDRNGSLFRTYMLVIQTALSRRY